MLRPNRELRRRVAFLAAALLAVVLVWLLLHSKTAPVVVAESAIPPSSGIGDPHLPVAAISPVAVAQAPPTHAGFNVSVHLQYESTDPLVLSKVREFYAALVSSLRAVPNLQFVEDHAVAMSDGPDDYRLTVSSLDPSNAQILRSTYAEWGAFVSVEVLTGKAAGTVYGLGMIGDAWKGAPKHIVTQGPLSGQCATPAFKPCTPAGIAEMQVMALRKHVFPRDGSLERELEAQFLDDMRPESDRQRLRNELKSMDIILSDAMVREALARLARPLDASSEHGENERYDLLIILAGQRHQEIVRPLIQLALHDSDVAFRIEALRLLAKDFPENPTVRAAMERVAADPSDPLQMFSEEMLNLISKQ